MFARVMRLTTLKPGLVLFAAVLGDLQIAIAAQRPQRNESKLPWYFTAGAIHRVTLKPTTR
jgi:hypothetical protein